MNDDFRWPGRTDLQLVFRVRGANLSPEVLTASTDVTPSATFHVGEAQGAYAKTVGGWDWESDRWTDADTEPLFSEALKILGPHEAVFAQCVSAGARISLTVVGSVYGEVISTPEEADRRRIDVGDVTPLRPFLCGDRVGIFLGPEIMGFLSRIGATFDTHIDAELDDRPH